MTEKVLPKMRVFSSLHRQYIIAVLNEVINYYGDILVGCAVFGSYARGDNRKNSDLDLLIILTKASGFSRRLGDFIDNIEMKHEKLAQTLYEQEDIFIELSPYILTREEALKVHPIYFDLIEHNYVIYDPEKIISRIINSTASSGIPLVQKPYSYPLDKQLLLIHRRMESDLVAPRTGSGVDSQIKQIKEEYICDEQTGR